MPNKKDIPCLILGIGNILWADEGFGVRSVERFNEKYVVEDSACKVLDGGTLGMYLFDDICRTENLLVFDCCDFHGKPGEMRVLRDDDIQIWTSTKISPHQDGMNDLLAKATLQLTAPSRITVIGFQPVLLDDYGGSLSKDAKAALDQAVEFAADELKAWRIPFRARRAGEAVPKLADCEATGMSRYEAGRPSQEAADRTGDRRYAYLLKAGEK